MLSVTQQREKLGTLAKQIRDVAARTDENGDLSAEDKAIWERVNAEYDAVKADLDKAFNADQRDSRLRELEAHEKELTNTWRREDSKPVDRSLRGMSKWERDAYAMRGYALASCERPVPEREAAAMAECGLLGNKGEYLLRGLNTQQVQECQSYFQRYEPRTAGQRYYNEVMVAGTGADGGYTIPLETFLQRLEVNLQHIGGVRQVAETIVTANGNLLTWPTVDDTAQTSVNTAENASLDASGAGGTNPTFAQVQWSAYKFPSGTALVSDELLEDSAFALTNVLAQLLARRIAKGTNTAYTTGDGTGDPHGIAVAATTGATAASATAFTGDNILQLVHSVDPEYRSNAGAGFMMHDNTLLAIRLLKELASGGNQFLWQPGLAAGVPDRLAGYPIFINQAMDASLATTDVAMVFGDLAAYKIRRVNGMRFWRLDELYRGTGNTGFVASVREDGKILTAGTAPIKKMVMA